MYLHLHLCVYDCMKLFCTASICFYVSICLCRLSLKWHLTVQEVDEFHLMTFPFLQNSATEKLVSCSHSHTINSLQTL